MIRDVFQSVRKLCEIWLELSLGIATILILPAVIQDYMIVAQIAETQADDTLRCAQKEVFGDIACEGIPVVLMIMSSSQHC